MKFSFDFLKKKHEPPLQQPTVATPSNHAPVVTSILCIPGPWKDIDEFAACLIDANGGTFLYAGGFVMSLFPAKHYETEMYERDERMRYTFKLAGKINRLSEDFLDEVDGHNMVIYLKGETGTFEKAAELANAGAAILKAGGIGIKVETTGKAFHRNMWLNLAENFEPGNLYEMYVLDVIVNSEGAVYSCGMHNLGLKDTIVSHEKTDEAINLLSIFGYYQVIDLPTILNNQTFSTASDSPMYIIVDEPNQPNKNHSEFENPFGMWRLIKMDR